MNWLFIVIVLLIFGFGVYGYSRGIIKMLFSVVSLFIAIIAMIVIAPFISSVLKNNESFMNKIEAPIVEVANEKLDEGIDVEGVLEEYYHFPKSVSTKISNYALNNLGGEKNNLSKSIAKSIAEYLCDIGTYLVVFIIVRIGVIVVGRALNIVEKLPVINTMNHLGGAALALIEIFLCIWIFFMAVELFSDTDFGKSMMQMIVSNEFLSSLYENNMLTFLLKKF